MLTSDQNSRLKIDTGFTITLDDTTAVVVNLHQNEPSNLTQLCFLECFTKLLYFVDSLISIQFSQRVRIIQPVLISKTQWRKIIVLPPHLFYYHSQNRDLIGPTYIQYRFCRERSSVEHTIVYPTLWELHGIPWSMEPIMECRSTGVQKALHSKMHFSINIMDISTSKAITFF